MNETFIVTTDAEPVVLRRHRQRDRPTILREHEIIAHAAAGGVPTPPAIRTPDGRAVVESDGRCYSLFAHADGAQVDRGRLRAKHARAMGVTLGQLHDILADYPPGRCPKPIPPRPAAVEATVSALRDLLEIVESWPDPGEQEEWAAGRLRSRIDWIDAHHDQLDRPAEPPSVQATHGDYQEANLFFDGDSAVTAVIDWDKAEPADPARELIRAMALAFGLDPTLCVEFLAGYRSRRALPLAALDAAAETYGHDRIHDTWLYDAIYRRRDDRPRAFLRPGDFHPFSERWLAVRPALEAARADLR
jgi:Ser/Thr protein kinase RdoA (MazF antagonist)